MEPNNQDASAGLRQHRTPRRKRVLRLAAVLLVVATVAALFRAQLRARRAEAFLDQQRILNQSIHDIDLGNSAPQDAVTALERTCGVPIHVSGMTTAAAFPQGWQEFFRSKLHDLTRAAIVRTLWTYSNGRQYSEPQIWVTRGGAVGVGPQAPVAVRLYAIGDLIEAFNTSPEPVQHVFGTLIFTPPRSARSVAAEHIVDLLVSMVRPDDWLENGGSLGRASLFADRIIICETPGGHAEIRQLLTALRTAGREGSQSSAPDDASSQSRANLERRIPELNFQNETLESAINQLREMTHSNILVYWQDLAASGIERGTPVRIHLWNTTLGGALDVLIAYVADGQPVHHDVRDNIIRIGTSDRLAQDADTSLRVYDVRDVVDDMMTYHDRHTRPRTQPATPTQMSAGSNVFADVLTARDATEQITNLIEDEVFPDSWKSNGGSEGTIYSIAGRLVIRQTPKAHKKIVALLRALRAGGSKEGTILLDR